MSRPAPAVVEDSSTEQHVSPPKPQLSPRSSPRYTKRPAPSVPSHAAHDLKFPSFGVTLEEIMSRQAAAFPDDVLPKVWTTLVRLVREGDGLLQEGIFRMSGSRMDIDRLKETLNKGAFDVAYSGDRHTVACALKQWIAELAEPLVTPSVYEATVAAMELSDTAAVLPHVYQAVRGLPKTNRLVLLAFVDLMRETLSFAAENKMSEASLAICFSPCLFQSECEDPTLYVRNSQCETRWVELLLRHPPTAADLDEDVLRPPLAAPPARGSGLHTPSSDASKRLYVKGTGSVLGRSSAASSFDKQFQDNNSGSHLSRSSSAGSNVSSPSSDVAGGDVENVSTFIFRSDVLQGYLMKENPNRLAKLWKRRWFVLQGKRLLYYAEARPGRPAGEGLKGFIPLQRASIRALPGYAKREFAFAIITMERTYHFQAADAQDLHYWISSLHDVLESPAMQAPDSEFTAAASSEGALLPARELSFAKDAFSGELERLGALKLWKKRHVVLSDGILYAFKRSGDKKPSERVFLYGSHLEEFEPTETDCVAFRVRAATGSDIVLRAPSTEHMARWTNAILRHRLAISEGIDNISISVQ